MQFSYTCLTLHRYNRCTAMMILLTYLPPPRPINTIVYYNICLHVLIKCIQYIYFGNVSHATQTLLRRLKYYIFFVPKRMYKYCIMYKRIII